MKPSLCPDDFRPVAKVYNAAAEYGVPTEYINSQVSEFVLYWRDKGALRTGWQRSFFNWCKQGWAWKMKDEAQRGVKQPRLKKPKPQQPQFSKDEPPIKVADPEVGKKHLDEVRKQLKQLNSEED